MRRIVGAAGRGTSYRLGHPVIHSLATLVAVRGSLEICCVLGFRRVGRSSPHPLQSIQRLTRKDIFASNSALRLLLATSLPS